MLWILLIVIAYVYMKQSKSEIVNDEINYFKYQALIKEAESNNNYKIENSIGALGAYQFMPSTLNSLQEMFKLPAWKPKEDFLNNPNLQDLYHKKLVESNLIALRNSGAQNWLGVIVSGSKNPKYKNYVSPANYYGFLAGAHLSGVGNVKKFFLSGHNPDDGHTSLSDYVAYFSEKGIT